ncbi:MAG TPA: metallophosphoesterase [Syntrophomonas sp.]|nr:metallophosphoesterase [Syntrophomonas sp.]
MPETMGASARIAFIAVFLFIWGGLNLYLGWRGWHYFGSYIHNYKNIYWILLIFLASSYFLGRWGNHHQPGVISDGLIWIGSYWMAFFFYALLVNVLIDLVGYLDKAWGFLPDFMHHSSSMIAAVLLLLIIMGLVYGTVNANRPVINQYHIVIPKQAGIRESLHMVMVSDIHLGNIVGRDRLSRLIDRVNLMEPEIVLLAGDIIDGDIRPFEEQKMGEIIRSIDAPLGVYAVPGNHEYLGGQYRQLLTALKDCGVTVLRDQYLLLDDFYLLGRDDKISRQRKPLQEVMKEMDYDYPIILMDHNPIDIEESCLNRVDLQLSGHTHKGQFWPLNLFTKRIFAQDWGYLRKENTQIIVSDGYGTWGPPIRIGNQPEIVDITIEFK